MRIVRPLSWIGVALVASAALGAARLTRPQPRAAMTPAGVTVMRDVMIPMRDGIRLATDIYRPAAANGGPLEGRFPVIMERTPYNKDGIAATARYFVPHDY